jgi:ABC-type glycerol-3-phosphate transport system substrate-binding protein
MSKEGKGMTMKKRMTIGIVTGIILIIAAYVLSFFTLFPDSSTNPEKEEVKDQPVTELTFWRNYGNSLENRGYREIIAAFEKENPAIKINMVSIPYGDYELKLRTEIAAGNPPDIMAIDSPNLAVYANSGSLLSIDKQMKAEGNMKDIPETTLMGLTYKEEIYLASIVESGVALFYNRHIFRDAGVPFPAKDQPLTWNEVVDIAKKLNNPSKDIYGIDPAQGFSDGESPAYFKLPILWQFGAEILSPDGSTAEGYLNSEQALEALQFYQDLYFTHKVAAVELPTDPFVEGHLGMSVMGSWTLADYEKSDSDFKLGEDYGIAPLPMAQNQVVPNGGWALGISQKTDFPDEAWAFVKYATSFEGAKKYVEITGDIPARYSVAKEFPELNQYPKKIFVQQAQNYSKNRPVTPAYPVVSVAIKELFQDVGISGQNVKEAADEAVEKINNGLKAFED